MTAELRALSNSVTEIGGARSEIRALKWKTCPVVIFRLLYMRTHMSLTQVLQYMYLSREPLCLRASKSIYLKRHKNNKHLLSFIHKLQL